MTIGRIKSADLDALDQDRLSEGGRPLGVTGTPEAARTPAAARGGSAALVAARSQRVDTSTGMNQTEAGFLREVLEALQDLSIIARVDFEPEGLRVGPKGSAGVYWPDFRVQWADGLVDFVEVKGHWLDDARVKFKAVAALHPIYGFHAARRKPKRDGGGWAIETIGAWPTWVERIIANDDRIDPGASNNPGGSR